MGNFVKFNSGWLIDKGYAIGTSLMLKDGYIGFDINAENGDVCGFGGFCEFTTVIKSELCKPKDFDNATLRTVFNGEEKILKGRASRIQWDPVMYIDEKNRIVMFGKFDYEKPSYRFLGNAFVQLDDDGDLLGIVLTDI